MDDMQIEDMKDRKKQLFISGFAIALGIFIVQGHIEKAEYGWAFFWTILVCAHGYLFYDARKEMINAKKKKQEDVLPTKVDLNK